MAELSWNRINALARAIEGSAGNEERLREQINFFLDLTEEEIVLARDLARWKQTKAGRASAKMYGIKNGKPSRGRRDYRKNQP